ncbi:MAG: flagellar motor protein MotB [Aequorivita sp.]|nr:flagellar motor protein MotB [Aequorivita sp.]|tara:strand:- start:127590 stop:129539 length:1950 start_codon:yes stop_codon:yes gene_type:complete
MTTIKQIAFIGLILLVNLTFAQEVKIARANEQYEKYSYINAQEIYLKVVENGYRSAEVYQKLGDTYYYNSDYVNAEKYYSKLLNEYPDNIETEYYYRIAQTLKSVGKYEKSAEVMKIYFEKGGAEPNVKKFENDPEYLLSLGVHPFKYVINNVGVNTRWSDFSPTYFQNKIVYSSTSKERAELKAHNWNNMPYLDLYIADVDSDGGLSNSRPLEGEVNTFLHEATPVFSKDGQTMYFTRNNFKDGKKGYDKNRIIKLKIYRATLKVNKKGEQYWGDILELPFNGPAYSTAHPALNYDENRLYFASDMPGGYGRSDLYKVDIKKDSVGNITYGAPVNLGPEVNTRSRETFPFVSEDNNLYFASDGHFGHGGLDIYVATLDSNGNLEQVSNFGPPINTNKDDFGLIIQESKGSGYYTSNAAGGRGAIDDEIYYFFEKCVMTINGVVTDIDTKELLPGAEVTLLNASNQVIQKVTVGEDATFSFTAECSTNYTLRGTKDAYYPKEEIVETPDVGGVINVDLQLKLKQPCPPNDLGCMLEVQPIYFDYDEDFIRTDAEVELAKILYAMELYPNLEIHIESHTDSRGRDAYNMKLSDRRAQSTREWIVERGIDKERISAKGYGESLLLNHCGNDIECTDEEHQLNRRSMFIIQN